jgi:SAM-dependent methyltransferase
MTKLGPLISGVRRFIFAGDQRLDGRSGANWVPDKLFTPLPDGPYVFGSDACRSDHFQLPLYPFWCRKIGETPKYHRKQWEFVYVLHALFERGLLQPGRRGLGFAVGAEPLPALFASLGLSVVATDLHTAQAAEAGWVDTNQHAVSLDALNTRALCDPRRFVENVQFRFVDMRDIPDDLCGFDFCWSACALEHLGSIAAGERFIRASLKTVKPGGIAVHTTELNLFSDDATLEDGPTVLFRRKDLIGIAERLEQAGHSVAPLNFHTGDGPLSRHVDLPPYRSEPHLKLRIEPYVATSFGLIIRRGAGCMAVDTTA